ncbi:MAG: flagellar M-ring protein FliF [Magnetococcales bacterium]|nr:flagellar M-ring protein FliF [Magnetococcales bacterium]
MAEMPTTNAAAPGAAEKKEPFDLSNFMQDLPLAGKTGMIIAAVAVILVLATLIFFSTRPSYKMLYSGLPEAEAGRVVEQLAQMNVPYELGVNGTTIRVPADRVADVRLEMATLGMPSNKGDGVGFEIFDKTDLTSMTQFMQNTNYQRALQGELARSIESLGAVRKARVHLVMARKSNFVNRDQHASASVVMDLSRALSAAQLQGVVHLVASGVEGLDEGNVTLLDSKGNLIAGGRNTPKDGRMPMDESLALQRSKEQKREQAVQTLLDRLLGPDRSMVRVTAELEFSREESNEETFDPEGQVPRSEQTMTEASRGVFGVGGVPGVQPNDPNAQAAGGGAGSNQSRNVEKETINYEISKKTKRIQKAVGEIKRLAIAVTVDGTYEKAKEEGKPAVYKPRSEDEMAQLIALIKETVGYKRDRGDTIEVKNIRFAPLPDAEEMLSDPFWTHPEFYLQILMGLVILALLFFVLRPLVKKLMVPEDTDDTLPTTVAELEQQLLAAGVGSAPAEKPMRMVVPDRQVQLAQQMIGEHIDEAREIIRGWMDMDSDDVVE